MASDKEPTEKIFCLFHKRIDCNCIAPVTDTKALKMRLDNAVTINELNNKFEIDEEMKARLEIEIEDWRARLAQI